MLSTEDFIAFIFHIFFFAFAFKWKRQKAICFNTFFNFVNFHCEQSSAPPNKEKKTMMMSRRRRPITSWSLFFFLLFSFFFSFLLVDSMPSFVMVMDALQTNYSPANGNKCNGMQIFLAEKKDREKYKRKKPDQYQT